MRKALRRLRAAMAKRKTWIIVDHDDSDRKVAGPFKTQKEAEIDRRRLEKHPFDDPSSVNYWVVPTTHLRREATKEKR